MDGRCIFGLVLLASCVGPVHAQPRVLRFSGEVRSGVAFRHDITPQLEFVLVPSRPYPQGSGGWTITVSVKGVHPAGCDDLVWVATPPYRSYNPRYLDLSYGTTPKEAVGNTPREFSFVQNCADYETEAARVDKVLWPGNVSKAEADEALAKLGTSPLGTGRFYIRESRLREPSGADPGEIEWIRFDVELTLP